MTVDALSNVERPWRCVCGHFMTLHKDRAGYCLGFKDLHTFEADDAADEVVTCGCEAARPVTTARDDMHPSLLRISGSPEGGK